MTVDEFDAYMATHPATTDLTLTFDVTGVNPIDFAGTKGCLADLTDLGCAAGGGLALKVYGPEYPPNTAHPSGTLKQEYGYNCGPMPYVETWADPNASAEIFVDGTERCDVTIWTNPATFGYTLVCDGGTFEGVGDNTLAMPVNRITLLALTNPDTWHLDNAVSTTNEVCFEADDDGTPTDTGTGEQTGTFEAIEDVTVAADHPTDVFPDVDDLCVEAGYCETYLKFDLSPITGTIVSASLALTAGDDPSSNGSGAEAAAVTDTSWSESTLTWNDRPGAAGAAVDRVGPVAAGLPYVLDVSSLLSAPGVYAFALRPAATDTDGAHFRSTEASATLGPRLVVTWRPDPPGGTTDSAPPGDTGAPPGTRPTVTDDPAPKSEGGCGCGATGPSMPFAAVAVALRTYRRRSRAEDAGDAPPTPASERRSTRARR